MERLSDWRAAAWLAACLAAVAVAAALLVPLGTKHGGSGTTAPRLDATLVPRTHVFGQPVTATLEVPASVSVHTSFAPYQVIDRRIRRQGVNVEYRFVIDCLRPACLGSPGTEREMQLPPVKLGLPGGKTFVGSWPPLRQASRLAPRDLASPVLRGDLTAPERPPAKRPRLLLGVLLGAATALALAGAAAIGIRRLGWRPSHGAGQNGRPDPSDLDYALLAAGLAAGSRPGDRRTALESLAAALDRQGLAELAGQARGLAWSPRPPAGESVRRLAERAQRAARKARA